MRVSGRSSVEINSTIATGNFSVSLFYFVAAFLVLFQLMFTTEYAGSVMLRFLNTLFVTLRKALRLPVTPATVRAQIGFDHLTAHLVKYIACPSCHSLYRYGDNAPQFCTYVRFPTHPSPAQRKVCNASLFSTSARPRKEYVYNSLVHTLQVLFSRPEFENQINEWRQRGSHEDMMFDVYDAAMWTKISDCDNPNMPFVEHRRSLLLTLNVDWFQPFTRSDYSCGAIYLTVNNLPRTIRFKTENVILVGLMPGPNEPRTDEINNYLKPLIDDLKELYYGVNMSTYEQPKSIGGTTVRAGLFMVACDIPAARKVCGFTSHSSVRACYKCDRKFTVSEDSHRVEYSGFDVSTWVPSTCAKNRENASLWKAARTKAEQDHISREYGVRWSMLQELPYFDIPKCTVIDPMHNLFLGTAKRMTDQWMKSGRLNERSLEDMQRLADTVLAPPSHSSMKRKIVGRFADMKASDWKSWCLIYSPFVLYKILPNDEFMNWMHFVTACRLIARPSLLRSEIIKAHEELLEFCRGCEILYGGDFITPNMHMHGHLMETLLDFGPMYGYWLFTFERYNGLIGDISSNGKDSIETTFAKRFIEQVHSSDFIRSISRHLRHVEELEFLQSLISRPPTSTTTISLSSDDVYDVDDLVECSRGIVGSKGSEPLPAGALPKKMRMVQISRSHYIHLVQFYRVAYQGQELFGDYTHCTGDESAVSPRIHKFKSLTLHGELYRSTESVSKKGSYIQALFEGRANNSTVQSWSGQILYFFAHDLRINGQTVRHHFALVRWLKEYSRQPFESAYVELWCDSFRPLHTDSILPVQRIYSPVAVGLYSMPRSHQRFLATIPLLNKTHY